MKIKWFNLLIVIGITAIAVYCEFLLNINETYKLVCSVFGVEFFANLFLILAMSFEKKSMKFNVNAVSIVFLIIFCILGIVFARVKPFKQSAFIISEGISVLLYLLTLKTTVQLLNKKE